MKFLVDENVSLAVVHRLKQLGHQVDAIAEGNLASLPDADIFKFAVASQSVLITRDWDFANSLLFPPEKTKGIIYIRYGNLKSEEEVALVENAIRQYPPENINGKLLTIYKNFASIR